MTNKPPLSKGLHVRIPIIIPIKGRGFINKGSTLLGMIFRNRRRTGVFRFVLGIGDLVLDPPMAGSRPEL